MFPARVSAFRQYADQGAFENSDLEHLVLLHQILEILCNFCYPNVTLLYITETEGVNDSLVFIKSHFLVRLNFPCYKV